MVASTVPPAFELPVSAEAVLDEVSLLIALLSPDGRILYVNGEVLRRSGEDYDQVVGKPFATSKWWTFRPGQAEQISEAIERALQGRVSHLDVEAQLVPTQRTVVDFEMRPLRDATGGVTAIVVQGRDITDQRTVERKLREAHFRWRIIADFTVDWEFWLHPGGHFLYSSPACQRITGHTPDEFVEGKVTITQLTHPDDRKRVAALITEAFSGAPAHSQRWRIVRRDRELRWISVSWQTVFDENGKPMGVRFSVRDVDDLHLAEEEQQNLLAAYRTLARHFPRGLVALLDAEMRFVVCDGPALDALPFNQSTIIGRRVDDVVGQPLLGEVQPLLTKAMSGTEVSEIVRAGDANWLVHLTPIPDENGRIAHLIASAVKSQDIWLEPQEAPTAPRR